MIPRLSDGELADALARARLTVAQREKLLETFNTLLHGYVVARVWEAGIRAVRPAQLAHRLEELLESAEKLLTALGDENDATAFAAWTQVSRAAQGKHFNALADFRQLREQLMRFRDASKAASARIEKVADVMAASRARNPGDPAMQVLFNSICQLWPTYFGRPVRVTVGANGAQGSVVRFLTSLLHGFAGRIPDRLEKLDPGLRARLKLPAGAIRERIRVGRTSSLPQWGNQP
jgi:hypothetical protein